MARERETTEQFFERLFFFWQIAQPLRHVFEELPELEKSIPLQMKLKVPMRPLEEAVIVVDETAIISIEQVAELAVEARWSWSMQNLSEAQFERLALRFRPFFAQKEKTHFLTTINRMAERNPAMRDWHQDLKASWDRAAFWGAMSIPKTDLQITTDSIISIGFYSRYFHVTKEQRAEAEAYEKVLGEEMYWLALVSSVWQRSAIVLNLATQIEAALLDHKRHTKEELEALAQKPVRPDRITQSFIGGVGAVRFEPIENP